MNGLIVLLLVILVLVIVACLRAPCDHVWRKTGWRMPLSDGREQYRCENCSEETWE